LNQVRATIVGPPLGDSSMMVSPANIHNILFVCTGNSCRSPLAEGLMKKLLSDSPIAGAEIGSAGLTALPGSPASFNAVRVAQENSISLQEHRARQVTPELIDSADLILVMEPRHQQELLSRHPEASVKTLLLRHFARYGSQTRGINDPYGLNLEAYRFCFEDIKECIESLHQWLVETNRA
ncbi:MAG: low molecular weight protein arginine phosphatase, partial [Syntrophobacterales bacterium]